MNLNKKILIGLFALLMSNMLWGVISVSPMKDLSQTKKEQQLPKLMERILFQKIVSPQSETGKELFKKRKALAERYVAEEELRDPVKKWFWNAFFFGVGGVLAFVLGALLSIQGEETGNDGLAATGYAFVVVGFLGIMVGFICGIIWLAKLLGA